MLTAIIIINLAIQLLILKQNKKMSEQLNEIKDALASAKVSADKVAADVTALHAKIDGIAEQPTAEEWAEVKQMATDLKDSLAATDAATPDEATATDPTTEAASTEATSSEGTPAEETAPVEEAPAEPATEAAPEQP